MATETQTGPGQVRPDSVHPAVPQRMLDALDAVAEQVAARLAPTLPKAAQMFRAAYGSTLETTVRPQEDGTVYVKTGDIPAMWLRDSSAQVRPYLRLAAHDTDFADLLVGVVRRQWHYIRHDPYANAFNESANGATWDPDDVTDMTPLVWERKYEIDSLAYPLLLAHDVRTVTGRTDHLGEDFLAAAGRILDTWDAEVDHEKDSPYSFYRATEGLFPDGKGSPVKPTGLLWCGFRPSDDPCDLHYLIPANAQAAVACERLAELLPADRSDLAIRARGHAERIRAAIAEHGVVEHPEHGRIYAYEVDGLGNTVLMDDANVPSLLSLPYIGWCEPEDELYRATRRFLLSDANPYYYSGTHAAGIGSPHISEEPYVWPIALAVQGLTATDPAEREALLATLAATDGGTGLMHEEFHVDDPTRFTRPWFAWANSMFAELCLLHAGMPVMGDEDQ